MMMNAELAAGNQCKVIIPTVYRDDYLLTIKKLTNDKDTVPYVTMLSKAHKFSAMLNFSGFEELYRYLESCNAFYEPEEGKRLIIN